jgi:hypothetical protein
MPDRRGAFGGYRAITGAKSEGQFEVNIEHAGQHRTSG